MMRAITAALLVLCACAMPSSVVRTQDARPTVAIQGAPAGARLVVDGNDVGEAAVYDGEPNVLRLEPGTHDIEVRDAGGVMFRQRVFLSSELKTLQVR